MNRKRLCIMLSVMVLVTVAVAAIACGGGDSGTATTTTVGDATTTSASTTEATEAETTTTAAATDGWVEVASLSGNANNQGESFALTGAPARLIYKVTGESGMVIAAFYVMVEGTSFEVSGGIPEVMVSDPGEDSTVLAKDPGNYYLEVKAANCDWEVTVEEQQ